MNASSDSSSFSTPVQAEKPHDYAPRPENGPGHISETGDARREAPAASRNRLPIRDVLERFLPESLPNRAGPQGLVLEIASGTGEHSFWYAQDFPHLLWQPCDRDPKALVSIEGWRLHCIAEGFGPSERARERGATGEAIAGMLPPLPVDVREDPWAWQPLDGVPLVAILNCNMVHISPWAACEGLMRGAAKFLAPAGLLCMYGPFRKDGAHTAPGNEEFDASLRERNAEWGVRDMEDVIREAEKNGLLFVEAVPMPANNFMLIFRRP